MIIDLHTILWDSPPQFGPAMADRIARRSPQAWNRPDVSVEAFDRAMADVTFAVIFGFESALTGAAITMQQVARYVQRRPGKYLGLAGFDPMSANISESVAAAIGLGLVGVVISPAAQGFHPMHSRVLRLYELCQDKGLPVFVLPGVVMSPLARLEFARPYLLDEVAREFPKLRMVIARVGGPWPDETLALLDKHQSVYADLSLLAGQPQRLHDVLVAAHGLGVLGKLVLGSGFPFSTPADAIRAIYSVKDVPRDLLRDLVERDTLSCLGIAKPAAADKPVTGDDDTQDVVMRVVTKASGAKESVG